MCTKKLIKRKRVSVHEAAEEEMASLTDSDDYSVILSWTEGHSSAKGDPQVKRNATGTGVSTEKLLMQMAKEIGALQKQVYWYFTLQNTS